MQMTRIAVAAAWLALVATSGCGVEPSGADYLERARVHHAAGEFRAAEIETRNALKDDPQDAEARLLLGELRLRSGDAAGAEKELRKARELGVSDTETVPPLARALLAQRKLDELLALEHGALPAADEADLLASRSLAHLANGDDAKARRTAERALALDADSAEARLALARLLASEGDTAGATRHVRDVLEATPGHAGGWELLGDLERFENRGAEAMAAYARAIEHAERPLSARLKRAELAIDRDERELALADLDALGKQGVKLPDIEVARGRLALRARELADAQTHFEEALTLDTRFAPALASLALTHLALGNAGQAEQYGKQLLVETGNSDSARHLLSAVRLENGRPALAEKTLEPIVRANLNDALTARLMSTAQLKQGKHDEAIGRMTTLALGLSPDVSATSLVFVRAPSRELLDDVRPELEPVEGDDGAAAEAAAWAGTDDGFLDEEERDIARVVELIGRGEHARALAAATALAESTPDRAWPFNLIARVHLANGQRDSARAAFERAMSIEARNPAANRALAELDLLDGDVETARARLETLLDGSGTEAVLLQLAQLEATAGDEAAMLELLRRARDENPGSADPVLALARYRASRAEHERALEHLATLGERDRLRPDALQVASVSQLALGRFDEALETLDPLVAAQPGAARWRHLRAQAHAGRGDTDATVRELRAALEIEPNFAPSQLALANAEILRGELDSAKARIETLRGLVPGTPELDRVVARLAAREAGETEGEIFGSPTGAVAGEAGTPESLRIGSTEEALAAARDLWQGGERERSTKLLDAWLEANPQDVTVRLTLANAYTGLERTERAIAEYETLLEADEVALPEPARFVTLNNLAWHLRERDPRRAAAHAERALELRPDSAETLDTLAVIRLEQGDPQAAWRAFERALAVGADDPTILFHGALIAAELDDTARARELLVPLVDGETDFPDKAEAARLLRNIGR